MPVSQKVQISRRELNKLRIRNTILNVSEKNFALYGIDGASLNEIADLSEISRSTLFKYFNGKAEIFEAIVERMNDVFFIQIAKKCDETDDPATRILAIFIEFVEGLERSSAPPRKFIGLSIREWNDPQQSRRMERFRLEFFKILNSGKLRGAPQIDYLVDIVVSIFIGLLHNWRTFDDYPLRQRLVEAAGEIAHMIDRHAVKI